MRLLWPRAVGGADAHAELAARKNCVTRQRDFASGNSPLEEKRPTLAKIRLNATQDVRDVAPDVAEMMVSARLAVALTPKEANDYYIKSHPATGHDLVWTARDGEYVDGMQYAPALVFRCQTCAQITYAHPMDKPAEPTTFHFKKHHCDAEVYATYLRLFDAWNAKGKRKLKGSYERNVEAYAKTSNDSMDRKELDRIRRGAVVTL